MCLGETEGENCYEMEKNYIFIACRRNIGYICGWQAQTPHMRQTAKM